MDDHDLRKPEYRKVFIACVDLLAFRAFIAALNHFLRLDERLEAVCQIYVTSDTNSFSRNRNAKVHEVIESIGAMPA